MAKYVSLDKLSHFLLQLKNIIPTKTSDLTNDSNYVSDASYVHTDASFTQAEKTKLGGIAEGANNYSLPTASASVLGGVKIGANITIAADGTISVAGLDWVNINGKPTNLSEFTNDAGFITKTVNDLSNYYAKTNTYSKNEVNSLIGDIKTIQIEKVASLPSTGASNKIYLVSNGGSNPNIYDEYIWVAADSKFEKIGTTEVDLSNYWSKTDLVEATESEINALFS